MSAVNDDPKSALGAVFRWACSQPYNNLITTFLLFGFGALGYGGYQFAQDVVKVYIPQHIDQIKAGYREVETSHEKSIDKIVQSWKEERERDREHTRELVDAIRGSPFRSPSGSEP